MTQGSKVCFGAFEWRKLIERGLVRETATGLEMTNKAYRLVAEQD